LVNKKPYAPEDELQDALDEMARDIALIETDPIDWGGMLSYLQGQLEGEAEWRGKRADYEEMLKSLFEDIESRIEEGNW
jgi:hypothetical protein